jgi:signal transduction histidine kinase
MTEQTTTDIAAKFGQIVGVEKAQSLVSEAASKTSLPERGPYTADEKIQICTLIENQETGVVANTAHEIRSRTEIKKHFESLFAVIPDPAMVVAQEYGATTVITGNQQAREMFDFEESLGEPPALGTVVESVSHENFEMEVHRHLASDDEFREQITIHNGGATRYFVARFSTIDDEQLAANADGQAGAQPTKQGVLVFTDITEQKSRQNEIEQLQQMTGVLNRVLRHNLRNSMTKILGTVDIVTEQTDDEEIFEAMELVTKTGTKLIEVSDNARVIQDCMQDVEPTAVDIASIVEDHFQTVPSEYESAEIHRETPDNAMAFADEHVHELLENVVVNAIEHNDKETPVVDIEVINDTDEVVLVVADNGPGIPDRELEVVDRGVESPLEHGAGLGLWLISWVTRQYGGDVSFEERDSGGTRVEMRFQHANA